MLDKNCKIIIVVLILSLFLLGCTTNREEAFCKINGGEFVLKNNLFTATPMCVFKDSILVIIKTDDCFYFLPYEMKDAQSDAYDRLEQENKVGKC
jgi:hypothetical protein